MTPAELLRRFTYHPPGPATRVMHDGLRKLEREYAARLDALLPGESREKSLAFTAFEESTFWGHAHLARNLDPETGDPR